MVKAQLVGIAVAVFQNLFQPVFVAMLDNVVQPLVFFKIDRRRIVVAHALKLVIASAAVVAVGAVPVEDTRNPLEHFHVFDMLDRNVHFLAPVRIRFIAADFQYRLFDRPFHFRHAGHVAHLPQTVNVGKRHQHNRRIASGQKRRYGRNVFRRHCIRISSRVGDVRTAHFVPDSVMPQNPVHAFALRCILFKCIVSLLVIQNAKQLLLPDVLHVPLADQSRRIVR